jgi:hypothetical protein
MYITMSEWLEYVKAYAEKIKLLTKKHSKMHHPHIKLEIERNLKKQIKNKQQN